MMPKECPKIYQGLGVEICWNCEWCQNNKCPYKSEEQLLVEEQGDICTQMENGITNYHPIKFRRYSDGAISLSVEDGEGHIYLYSDQAKRVLQMFRHIEQK